jgi:uncharacterized protein YaeQ
MATLFHLEIELADVDRGVYDSLDLRLARHPSESMPYLLTRTIAYALLYEEGLAFSKGGLSSADEPALTVHDPQGILRVWIEIGAPSPDRLHKASKASPRVVVFAHQHPRHWLAQTGMRDVHKAERIEVYALDPKFLEQLGELTDRNAKWTLLRNDGVVTVTIGDRCVSGPVTKHALPRGE